MVKLVEFSESHLASTYQWITEPGLRKYFLFSRQVTPESHKRWFELVSRSETEKLWAIYWNGLHVGNIGLKNIDLKNKVAETWIYLGDVMTKGRGVGYEAYVELFKFLLSQKKILGLYCHVASFNHLSIRLFAKLGFVRENDFKEMRVWQDEPYELYKFTKQL